MDARTGISIDEYLHTSFPDLDREYRDGELVERSLPTYLHGKVQLMIAAIFAAKLGAIPVFPRVETRMKIRNGLYRIPDLAVFYPHQPADIPEEPPLVVVEILSPGDPMAPVREKLEEYRDWGVRHVWLVDPYSKRIYTCEAGLREVDRLTAPEIGVEISGAAIFS
jgi:Uma2 family endonuclease